MGNQLLKCSPKGERVASQQPYCTGSLRNAKSCLCAGDTIFKAQSEGALEVTCLARMALATKARSGVDLHGEKSVPCLHICFRWQGIFIHTYVQRGQSKNTIWERLHKHAIKLLVATTSCKGKTQDDSHTSVVPGMPLEPKTGLQNYNYLLSMLYKLQGPHENCPKTFSNLEGPSMLQ